MYAVGVDREWGGGRGCMMLASARATCSSSWRPSCSSSGRASHRIAASVAENSIDILRTKVRRSSVAGQWSCMQLLQQIAQLPQPNHDQYKHRWTADCVYYFPLSTLLIDRRPLTCLPYALVDSRTVLLQHPSRCTGTLPSYSPTNLFYKFLLTLFATNVPQNVTIGAQKNYTRSARIIVLYPIVNYCRLKLWPRHRRSVATCLQW